MVRELMEQSRRARAGLEYGRSRSTPHRAARHARVARVGGGHAVTVVSSTSSARECCVRRGRCLPTSWCRPPSPTRFRRARAPCGRRATPLVGTDSVGDSLRTEASVSVPLAGRSDSWQRRSRASSRRAFICFARSSTSDREPGRPRRAVPGSDRTRFSGSWGRTGGTTASGRQHRRVAQASSATTRSSSRMGSIGRGRFRFRDPRRGRVGSAISCVLPRHRDQGTEPWTRSRGSWRVAAALLLVGLNVLGAFPRCRSPHREMQ